MRSPPQIALEPLPQAHRVAMSIEKLIDHERQHIAVVVRDSSAGWSDNGSAARYQHDFSSNYSHGRPLSRTNLLHAVRLVLDPHLSSAHRTLRREDFSRVPGQRPYGRREGNRSLY